MPTIPAQVFDGQTIPQITFESCSSYPAYVSYTSPPGTAPVGSQYFTYDLGSGYYRYRGVIASPEPFPDDDTAAYRNLVTFSWTYDNKPVYWGKTGEATGTNNFSSAGWTVQNNPSNLTDAQFHRIAWLMLYGGYTDGFSKIFAPNKAIKIYVGNKESIGVYYGSVAVFSK